MTTALDTHVGNGHVDLLHEVETALARKWALTPVKGKRAVRKGWESEPPVSREVLRDEMKRGCNCSLRTGKASGIIVLDDDRAKHGLAPLDGLPKTVTVLTGGNGTHRYFRYPEGVEIGCPSGRALGEYIDIKGEGGAVVYPGSVHPDTSQQYRWADGLSPDDVPIADLPGWVLKALTEKPARRNERQGDPEVVRYPEQFFAKIIGDNVAKVRAATSERNNTLNAAAFDTARYFWHGLSRIEAENELRSAALDVGLGESEIAATLRSAFTKGEAEPANIRVEQKSKGKRKAKPVVDATPDRIIESKDPMPLARNFLHRKYTNGGTLLLRRYRGEAFGFDGVYRIVSDELLGAEIRRHVETLATRDADDNLKPIAPTKHIVGEILAAIPACGALLDESLDAPFWIDGDNETDPREIVVAQNGWFSLRDCELHPATPKLFATNVIGTRFDPGAPKPVHWLAFIDQILQGDEQSIVLLQEWFGYCLATSTRQQKALMIVGPKRAGKGVIARVQSALVGRSNIVGPTLSGLAGPFGLQSLIGKQVAFISDARLSSRSDQAQIVERLLSITGEDGITVDRKHTVAWTGTLPTRFCLLTNELPRLQDVSGALASRFLIIVLHESFYGREDIGLSDRLLEELPGILNWAIAGWDSLQERGHFVQPESALDTVEELENLSSPIRDFVTTKCHIAKDGNVQCAALYKEFVSWCKESGRDHVGNIQAFGSQLRAAVAGVTTKQIRINGKQIRVFVGITL